MGRALDREEVLESDWFLRDFRLIEGAIGGGSNQPIHQLRRDAIARFQQIGFPGPRDEDWKYTNLSRLTGSSFEINVEEVLGAVQSDRLNEHLVPDLEAMRLVFLDGQFCSSLSSIEHEEAGFTICPIAQILERDSADPERCLLESKLSRYAQMDDLPFVALNTAFVRDGVFLHLQKAIELQIPVHVLYVSTGNRDKAAVYPRLFANVERHCSLTLIESFVGLTEASYFTCGVSEILIDENAQVKHFKLGVEGANACHVSSTHIRQSRDSRYDLKMFSLGGRLVRNEVYPMLCDEGIESNLAGLTVIDDAQHVDNFTVVEHAKPHSSSNQLFKGIFGGESRGVFTGTIVVAEQAQKTNAFQSSANLLLSDTAQVDTRPQLKIWADDVKCSHGATIGQLDDEALFYLRSRGIDAAEAKNMLVHAFANEVLNSISIDELRDYVCQLVDSALATDK